MIFRNLPCVLLILLAASPFLASAAEPPPLPAAPAEYECRWTEGPIKLDGVADEAAWKDAQTIDRFGLPWLGEKARPPRTATKARLLWDREYLYFFAEMADGDLYADVKEHDGQTWDNDVFELFFKPADDKPGYYEFQVNAAGTVMDMFMPRRGAGGFGRFKADGEFKLEAKVQLRGTLNKWNDRDEGWSVEGRLPWRDLARTGGRPQIDERWKFTLCRYDYSVDFEGPELSNINPKSSVAHADFHRFEDYATLRFIGPPKKSAAKPYGIDAAPKFVTSRVVGSPDPPLPYRVTPAYPNLKLNFPISVAHQPGTDWMWVIVQPFSYGQTSVVRFRDAADVRESEPLLPVAGDVVAYDICFHPKFAENGYVYIGSNGKFPGAMAKTTRITRYTVSRTAPHLPDAASATVILEWASDGHNGAAVCFGRDGMMYVTSGDGTSDSDRDVVGQDMTKIVAKVLRIDVDHPAPGQQYGVPKDNPFLANKDVRPETYAAGLRNPWRIHCDRETGHIWVGNNGQDLWEQVYFVRPGDNFGWSVTEGSHPFYPNRAAGPKPFALPAAEHHHSEARSLTGGIVSYGSKLPELRGAYLYGDYSTGKIWGLRHDGKQVTWHKELADTTLQITCFAADSRGELLIADHRRDQGGFYRLEPVPADAPKSDFPRRLSETGLFASVPKHEPAAGLVPYSVNASLWSDGTFKTRYLAIPHKEGEDRRIDFGHFRGWALPDETVLVKSFALELEEGKPESRRWIETRLLTRQQGEWVGYSYRWNDEQTEATLVEREGADQEFTIVVHDATKEPYDRKQVWHYPSRTECMVCHSRAANFVLGLSTLQMNKDHDYGGGRVDNQLRVLEHLGLLRVNWAGEEQHYWREEWTKEGKPNAEIDRLVAARTATRDQRAAKPTHLLHVPPEKLPRLVDPYDETAALDERARSYLHANCSICHVEAGGGNAKLEIEFNTPREKLSLFGEKPVHHTFDLPDARLVAPGHPERSVLLHRVALRGPGQMPQLATSRTDQRAIALLREWIRQMPVEGPVSQPAK